MAGVYSRRRRQRGLPPAGYPGGLLIDEKVKEQNYYKQLVDGKPIRDLPKPSEQELREMDRVSTRWSEEMNAKRYDPVHHRYTDPTTQRSYEAEQNRRRERSLQQYTRNRPHEIDSTADLHNSNTNSPRPGRRRIRPRIAGNDILSPRPPSPPKYGYKPHPELRDETTTWLLTETDKVEWSAIPPPPKRKSYEYNQYQSSRARAILDPAAPAVEPEPKFQKRILPDPAGHDSFANVYHTTFRPTPRSVRPPVDDITSFETRRQQGSRTKPPQAKRVYEEPHKTTFNIITGAGDSLGKPEENGFRVQEPPKFLQRNYGPAYTEALSTRGTRVAMRNDMHASHFALV